jgi:hypothetical protein
MNGFQPFDVGQSARNALAIQQVRDYPQDRQNMLRQGQMDEQAKGFQILEQGAKAVMANPAMYPTFKANMERLGIAGQGELPDQFDQKMITGLAQYAANKGTPSFVDVGISPEGESIQVGRDPATGRTWEVRTPTGVMTPREKADLKVETARRTKTAEIEAKEDSDVRTDIYSRARIAASGQVKTNKALKLANMATQGIPGQLKLFATRVFPGIDASDEAALGSAFKQMALDELAAFKGPTTDFEYGVAEGIGGTLGEGPTANIARIKAVKRAQWFTRREAEQLKKFKGRAIEFMFDFQEKVKTKKGEFTLEDLQDTAVENHMTIEEVLKRLNQ